MILKRKLPHGDFEFGGKYCSLQNAIGGKHPGQSFSLSLFWPIFIRRVNAHMVHMGLGSGLGLNK